MNMLENIKQTQTTSVCKDLQVSSRMCFRVQQHAQVFVIGTEKGVFLLFAVRSQKGGTQYAWLK